MHHPADSHPREIQNFISASGNGFGVTMSSCVAVADWIDPSRDQSDYPVLQGILLFHQLEICFVYFWGVVQQLRGAGQNFRHLFFMLFRCFHLLWLPTP